MRRLLLPVLATGLAVLGSGCSLLGISSVEEAPYELLMVEGDFEIREYAEMVQVEVLVGGEYRTASNAGFRQLFGYISGQNAADQEIAMTAPVFISPVQDDQPNLGGDRDWEVAFVLPAGFSLDGSPQPSSAQVNLVSVPAGTMAVLRFSGRMNSELMSVKRVELQSWMDNKGLEPGNSPMWAGYNPPWTPGFLRRNEILVPIKS